MKIQAAQRMRSLKVASEDWKAPFKKILEPLAINAPPDRDGCKITKEQWLQVEKAFKDKGYEIGETDFDHDVTITPKGDGGNGLYFDFEAMKIAWYEV